MKIAFNDLNANLCLMARLPTTIHRFFLYFAGNSFFVLVILYRKIEIYSWKILTFDIQMMLRHLSYYLLFHHQEKISREKITLLQYASLS